MTSRLIFIVFTLLCCSLNAQVPAIEVEGNGIQLPRLTNAERDAILNPQAGLLIFNTESLCMEIYRGAGWYNFCKEGQFVSQPLNKLLGGNSIDIGHTAISTVDGGFVVAGYSLSSATGDVTDTSKGAYDYWVVKLDASGNIIWDKLLGGSNDDIVRSVVPTTDGGFVIAGHSLSSATGDVTETSKGLYDYWVVKLDASGNIIWNKLLGGSDQDFAQLVAPATDGGFVVVGHSFSSATGYVTETSNGAYDYWVVKLDAGGNIIWNKLLGGSDNDFLYSVTSAADGGFVVVGHSLSSATGDVTDTSKGLYDYWVVRLDASGNKLWDKLLGGSDSDFGRIVAPTTDGGFIVAGHSSSSLSGDVKATSNGLYDYWVMKLDAGGNIIWNKLFGGSGNDFPYSITSATDGGFVIAGYSSSSLSGDVTGTNNGGVDYWVVKLDASGNKVWDKLLGGSGEDYGFSISATTDGGFVIAGYSTSSLSGDVTDTNNGGVDYWIVKLDTNGNIQN